ncbi:alpha/beta fold hydrolase [Flavisphingomonas formosensis]|uniref:alpha/beta fold hydrolase n=1 Tax=Flavisphingomonas formosensis TaxID=861534 RepID=UPI0012FB45C7|nr:alpha/beta hydrolase [Sphingomonas formosensis]
MLIVLVPGLMNDGWVWRHQIGPLSRIAPVAIARTDGCDTLAAMAERVLAIGNGPLCVVGHSMGARVAMEAALQDPRRVARLGLLNSGMGPPTPGEAEGRMRLVALARQAGMEAVAAEWLPPMLGAAGAASEGLVDGITEMLRRCTPDAFAAQQNALIHRSDRRPALSGLPCPVFLATGDEDRWSSADVHREMASEIPLATLRIVAGSGHFLPVEAPDALTDVLLDWLRD